MPKFTFSTILIIISVILDLFVAIPTPILSSLNLFIVEVNFNYTGGASVATPGATLFDGKVNSVSVDNLLDINVSPSRCDLSLLS